jgi:polyisoprenoid-binding protein YceI
MELTVEKSGLLSGRRHLFTFSRFNGELSFDPADPVSSTITIAIDSGSIECHDTWLSPKDLRKVLEYAHRDMLASDRFQRLSFTSTKVSRTDGRRFLVEWAFDHSGHNKPGAHFGGACRTLGAKSFD